YRPKAAEPPPAPAAAPAAPAPSWRRVFADPLVWRLMLARMLTDPVWYFFQFWMPKYLHDARGLDQKGLAVLWVVFLAADAGFLLGGFFSGRGVKRGLPAPAARVRIMTLSACLVPASFLIPSAPALAVALGLAMAVAYAHTAWLGNLTSLVVDLVPKPVLGTAFGVIACGSVLGGIAMNQAVAWLATHRSYDACFYAMACAHPLALLLVRTLRRRPAAA
ncbi:MAG TPA: MFS transporter, partial [Candidatus Methylacidiphilales bacterium]